MFSTKEVTVSQGNGGGKYLSPGINDGAKLLSITSQSPDGKAPFLEVKVTKETDAEAQTLKLYMSSGAMGKSLEKLVHLLQDGMGLNRAAIDAASDAATSLPDLAAKMNTLAANKAPFRLKLVGREYTGQDGSVKTARELGLPPFAEPLTVNPSKLTYDPMNAYDYQAIPKPDAAPVAAGGGGDELPF